MADHVILQCRTVNKTRRVENLSRNKFTTRHKLQQTIANGAMKIGLLGLRLTRLFLAMLKINEHIRKHNIWAIFTLP